MHTIIPLALGGIIATWAMLALIGGERERRISEFPPPSADSSKSESNATTSKASKTPAASKPVR